MHRFRIWNYEIVGELDRSIGSRDAEMVECLGDLLERLSVSCSQPEGKEKS